MSSKRNSITGFTIVELLIVIIVIGVLTAITVIAFNGMQQRGRDTDRRQGVATIKKALELYKIDNNGYPQCGGGAHVGGTGGSGGSVDVCLAALVPTYIASLPKDPINTINANGTYRYHYAVGYKKTGTTTYAYDMTSNYVLGVKLESVTSPTFSGWSYNDFTLLEGS